MNLLSERKKILPVLMIVCSVQIGVAQQMQKSENTGITKTGCAPSTSTVTALPRHSAAQVTEDPQENPYGTFQFISKKGEPQEFFTEDILKVIEQNRLEDEDRILQYTERTRINIPSKRTVGRRSYKPFTTLYTFE